jgi:hypothetical protein
MTLLTLPEIISEPKATVLESALDHQDLTLYVYPDGSWMVRDRCWVCNRVCESSIGSMEEDGATIQPKSF